MGVNLVLLLFIFGACSSLKIAIFAPYMSNSNVLWNTRVGEELARAGHDVTIYGIQEHEMKQPKIDTDERIRIVLVNASLGEPGDDIMKAFSVMAFQNLPFWDSRMREIMGRFADKYKNCEKILENEGLIKSIEEEHFDLAFTHMYNFCPIGIIHLTRIPTWIWLNSGALIDNVASLMGVPLPPSYCSPMMMDAGDRLSFFERVKSFIGHAIFGVSWRPMLSDKETAVFRKRFGPRFPDLAELAAKAPLVMVNSNELYDFPRPTLAKIVNIGGIGIKTKDAKPLTGEFKTRADRAKEGIVTMSFGSVAPMYLMPYTWKTAYFNAFEKMPDVEFFLRYEHPEEIADILPKNAYAATWLPQTDLLQHPKSLGLISHGGYNSIQDVIHAGTPILTTGLFGDQPRNAHLAKRLGLGVNLHKDSISNETVLEGVKRLVYDRTLRSKARQLKEMVATKPIPAETLLLRWTEFLGQHKTLDNLVPVGAELPLFVYHSMDVILFLSVSLLVVLYILFIILRRLYRCICCRRNRHIDEIKKNQ